MKPTRYIVQHYEAMCDILRLTCKMLCFRSKCNCKYELFWNKKVLCPQLFILSSLFMFQHTMLFSVPSADYCISTMTLDTVKHHYFDMFRMENNQAFNCVILKYHVF